MPQDKNRLPEGTDKVIPGAADTGIAEVVVVEAVVAGPNPRGGGGDDGEGLPTSPPQNSGITSAETTSGRRGGSRGTGGSGAGDRDEGTGIMGKVRSGGEKLSGQAADKARDFVGQGLERSSEALANVGRLVGDTAEGLDERLGPEYGEYARRAASAIDSTAQKLASKNPEELIDDTRNFVRKSPGVALAGAAIVGFALARLVKSGLDSSDREGGGDSGRTGGDGR